MKKIIYICLGIMMVFIAGCDKDDDMPVVYPEKTGTVTDVEGNEYKWVRFGGLDWLATNFCGGMSYAELRDAEGYLVFSKKERASIAENIKIYGNLCSYEDAKANAELLGEGWRLPTDEDWQKLETALGMSAKAARSKGWRGAPVGELLCQDSTGTNLNFMLGGCVAIVASNGPRDLELGNMREYGFYWTATPEKTNYDGEVAYYRCIRSNASEVERNVRLTAEKDSFDDLLPTCMSVRYVRDAKD